MITKGMLFVSTDSDRRIREIQYSIVIDEKHNVEIMEMDELEAYKKVSTPYCLLGCNEKNARFILNGKFTIKESHLELFKFLAY